MQGLPNMNSHTDRPPSENFQNSPSYRGIFAVRMEFLSQTGAVRITQPIVHKSLLLKLSKHVDYTLID